MRIPRKKLKIAKRLATEYVCSKYPQYKGKEYDYIKSRGGGGLLKAFIWGYAIGKAPTKLK